MSGTTMAKTSLKNVTLYFRSDFGSVRKVEALECEIEIRPFAQYSRGIYVEYKEPRQRQSRFLVQDSRASLLVLDGWGHPSPVSTYKKANDCIQSRYSSHDAAWQHDFDAMIGKHIASGAVVLADFRGHDPGLR